MWFHYNEESPLWVLDCYPWNMINFIIMKIRDIGLFISRRRKALGVNQKELAVLCGVSEHALCNLERGIGNPTLKLVTAVAEALGIELNLRAKDMESV